MAIVETKATAGPVTTAWVQVGADWLLPDGAKGNVLVTIDSGPVDDSDRLWVDLRPIVDGVEVAGSNYVSSWGFVTQRVEQSAFPRVFAVSGVQTFRTFVRLEDDATEQVTTVGVVFEHGV